MVGRIYYDLAFSKSVASWNMLSTYDSRATQPPITLHVLVHNWCAFIRQMCCAFAVSNYFAVEILICDLSSWPQSYNMRCPQNSRSIHFISGRYNFILGPMVNWLSHTHDHFAVSKSKLDSNGIVMNRSWRGCSRFCRCAFVPFLWIAPALIFVISDGL